MEKNSTKEENKTKPKNIYLIGNPNTGKTTLFNNLTGLKQKIGNWAGVTVDKKQGEFKTKQSSYLITDLPGIYDLPFSDSNNQDLILVLSFLFKLDFLKSFFFKATANS